MLKNIKAVIFDVDGTLIDSMGLWNEIDIEFLGNRGIEMPSDLKQKIAGLSAHEVAVYFKDRFAFNDSVDELLNIWNDMAYEKYLHEVNLKPGALELMQFLHDKGIKMAIGTSNVRTLIDASFTRHDLGRFIDVVISSEDVVNGKPAPDVYLLAAERLCIDPSQALVFEDIIQGAKAAKSAGMQVCGVYDTHSTTEADAMKDFCDYYVDDFFEVLVNERNNN